MNATTSALVSRTYDRARIAGEAIGHAREQSQQTRESLARCIVAEEHIRSVALRFPFLADKLPPS